MKARIEALNLTTLEIGARGGPGRGALREILNARRVPRKSTLEEIDVVLGWPPGVAKDILDGRREAPDPHEWLDLPAENRLGLLRSGLVHLRKEHYRLSESHRETAEMIGDMLDLLDAERG